MIVYLYRIGKLRNWISKVQYLCNMPAGPNTRWLHGKLMWKHDLILQSVIFVEDMLFEIFENKTPSIITHFIVFCVGGSKGSTVL